MCRGLRFSVSTAAHKYRNVKRSRGRRSGRKIRKSSWRNIEGEG
jgi:hypothetical protein